MWLQSQVESYQTLKKWYLMPPCLTLNIVRYKSRVKWSNAGKRVAPSPTPWCSRYWKRSLLVALDYDHQLYIFFCSRCWIIYYTIHVWTNISFLLYNVCRNTVVDPLFKDFVGWLVGLRACQLFLGYSMPESVFLTIIPGHWPIG